LELVFSFFLWSLVSVGCVEECSMTDQDDNNNRVDWVLKWVLILVLAIIFALEIVG